MSDQGCRERPEPVEAPAAFQRLQKLTKALLGVSKGEYDQRRAEYERNKHKEPKRSR